ncbi:putative Inner membrane protein yrbE [Corchorus olitorius]|uniref:Inner membrane protein yrbE n=1 Tax=Corchorus olitorius TaxID=93759 RepID=A0A1R3KE97_9ROSI|nr:putative Inner membrane protein yrbE [Corchorus olitorius]
MRPLSEPETFFSKWSPPRVNRKCICAAELGTTQVSEQTDTNPI